jgi:hypothetical protein
MEEGDLSYPQKGDSLCKEIAHSRHNVCVDPYFFLSPLGDNWAQYIVGYKKAADILVDKIIDNRSIQDSLAFPTIFLYRHFIELSLKLIIRYGYQLFDIQNDYRQIHDIVELWRDCRVIIENRWPNGEYETLDATASIIKQFSKIDPTSFETRYPEKRDGNFTMEGTSYINLKNMKKLMGKIDNFLGSICDAISIELAEKKDIESEYNSD